MVDKGSEYLYKWVFWDGVYYGLYGNVWWVVRIIIARGMKDAID